MRSALRTILPLLLVAAAPAVAEAQRGFPGSVRGSPRPLVDEVPPPAGALAMGEEAKTEFTWLLGTAGNTSSAGSSFSTLGGLSVKFVVPVTLDATVSYQRAIPDGLDATDAFGATLELGTSHEVIKDTLEFGVSTSGDVGWEGKDARSYTAGVSASATILSRLELGGNLAYAGSDPETGDMEWDLVPGVSASVFPMEDLTLGIDYTFENDPSVENGYEVAAKYTVRRFPGRAIQLRIGVDSDERVGAGIILTF